MTRRSSFEAADRSASSRSSIQSLPGGRGRRPARPSTARPAWPGSHSTASPGRLQGPSPEASRRARISVDLVDLAARDRDSASRSASSRSIVHTQGRASGGPPCRSTSLASAGADHVDAAADHQVVLDMPSRRTCPDRAGGRTIEVVVSVLGEPGFQAPRPSGATGTSARTSRNCRRPGSVQSGWFEKLAAFVERPASTPARRRPRAPSPTQSGSRTREGRRVVTALSPEFAHSCGGVFLR